MELINTLAALGDALDLVPMDAIDAAHRAQMAVTLNSICPTLELARAGHWEQLDAVAGARYANAASSLLSQVQLTAPGPERNCMDSLVEAVGASVRKLRDRSLEPVEAAKILELIGAATIRLQSKSA